MCVRSKDHLFLRLLVLETVVYVTLVGLACVKWSKANGRPAAASVVSVPKAGLLFAGDVEASFGGGAAPAAAAAAAAFASMSWKIHILHERRSP